MRKKGALQGESILRAGADNNLDEIPVSDTRDSPGSWGPDEKERDGVEDSGPAKG